MTIEKKSLSKREKTATRVRITKLTNEYFDRNHQSKPVSYLVKIEDLLNLINPIEPMKEIGLLGLHTGRKKSLEADFTTRRKEIDNHRRSLTPAKKPELVAAN